MIDDGAVTRMAEELAGVGGVVGVVLGGSRARGDALPTSDVDLGVYYRGGPELPTLDLDALGALADRWSDTETTVGAPGSWGPWVDAGGWLSVAGTPVDWILRDVDRVREQCDRARAGRFAFHRQPGHPLGFLDVAYAGELATGKVLADPSGGLGSLRADLSTYPPALREAMVEALWEAEFILGGAAKAVARRDTAYVVLCATQALLLCAHALHAHEGRWVTNEKGLLPGVARLDRSPAGFADRAALALGSAGTDEASLSGTLEAAMRLVGETRGVVDAPS